MERLTNRNYGEISHTGRIIPYSTHCIGCITKDCDCGIVEDMVKKLVNYEDLEEQGRLIKLPCKVGDTVYCIENKEIYTCTVGKISISKNNGVWVEINFPKEMPDIVAIEYNLDDIGKTVFLTKSGAEAKLKELRGGKNE